MGQSSKHADYFEGGSHTGHSIDNRKVRKVDGKVLLPSMSVLGSISTNELGDQAIVLETQVNPSVSFYNDLTPAGARAVADALNQMADEVDNHIANQASAAIERSRKGGA